MRRLVLVMLVASCGAASDDPVGSGTGTSSSGADTSTSLTTTDPVTTDPTTTDPVTTDPVTTDSATTDPTTSEGSTSTSDESTGPPDPALGCAFPEEHDTTDGSRTPVMETWGAPCTTDDDCVAVLGDGGVCLVQVLVYELPLGYCTKPCALPDAATRVVEDDPTCAPEGGVACVGQQGIIEMCAVLCTDDAQCNRDGYVCRQIPMLAQPEDPSICLMPDCCLDTCEE